MLVRFDELRPVTRARLIEEFFNPEMAYYADEKQLTRLEWLTDRERCLLSDKSLSRAEEILVLCREQGVGILTLKDAAYPERLRTIFDPPVALYTKGSLPAIDSEAAIAVVGTRKATPYGFKLGRKMGFEIARCGGLVLSGIAAGVDSAAADGALRAGGICVGVIGCAIDSVYPVGNDMMYEDVLLPGALISEYPPGTPTMGKNFPERNRILSGLSVGLVVVEAPGKSGALITASRALDQGREVFAVPGAVDMPNSEGANRLIREGAVLVRGGWDVLCEFQQRFPEKLSENEQGRLTLPPEEELPRVEYSGKNEEKAANENHRETGKGFMKLRENIKKKIAAKRERIIGLKDHLGPHGNHSGLSPS